MKRSANGAKRAEIVFCIETFKGEEKDER